MRDYEIKKRSLLLNGHKTSIGLEDPFWQELKTAAKLAELDVGSYVYRLIGARQRPANLSSALRCYLFEQCGGGKDISLKP